MSYQKLKVDFVKWLKSRYKEDLGWDSSKYEDLDSNISVFAYNKEFKDYLKEQKSIDLSQLNISLCEFLFGSQTNDATKPKEDKAQNENQQQVTQEEDDYDSFLNNDNTESIDDNSDITKDDLSSEENSLSFELFNDFLSEEIVKKSLDSNSNGTVDKDEIQLYLSEFSNKDEINFDDLVQIFENIQNNTLQTEEDAICYSDDTNTDSDIDLSDKKEEKLEKSKDTPSASAIPSTSSVSSSGASTSSQSENKAVSNASHDPLDSMSLDELKQAKVSEQNEIDSTNQQIQAVINGEDGNISQDEQNVSQKEQEYKNALINNEKMDDQKAQLIVDIEKLNEEIKGTNQKQEIFNNIVESQQETIKNNETYISSLTSTLNLLPSSDSSDYPNDSSKAAKIEEKRSQVTQMIEKAKQQLEQDKTTLEEYKQKKEQCEEQITKQNEELQVLKDKLGCDIEEVINNMSEQTKKIRSEYGEAKSKIENDKNEKLSSLQQILENQNEEMAKLDNKIIEKSSKEYSPNVSVLPNSLFKGRLEGKEELVCEIAEKYGLDAILVASIIILESGWGKYEAASDNFMGYTGSGDIDSKNRFGAFSTIEKGLDACIKNLASYAQRYDEVSAVDYDNLDAIGAHYCPGGSWQSKVRSVYQTILSKM